MSRGFANVIVDDKVCAGLNEIFIPSARDVQVAALANRRRVAKIKEDTVPLEFELRGWWIDDPANGLYWRDFKAALLNQVQQAFDMGDGTEFRMVDVKDVVTGNRYGEAGNGEAYYYTAKCLSYEPYTRSKSPTLDPVTSFGYCPPGVTTYSGGYNYAGTGPGEPTWQWKLVLPAGTTCTTLVLQNTSTGEICIVSGLSLTNGTYYLLMDACGGASVGRTPTNNEYGLLAIDSLGYGVTLEDVGDLDFTGNPPTLRNTVTLPPTPTLNTITASVTLSGGGSNGISLEVLAPSRWIR